MQKISDDISKAIYGRPIADLLKVKANTLWGGSGESPSLDPPYFNLRNAESWWLAQAQKIAVNRYSIRITNDYSTWLPDDRKITSQTQSMPDYIKTILSPELALWATLTDKIIIKAVSVAGDFIWHEIYGKMDKDIRHRIIERYYPCSRQEFYDHYAHIYRDITGFNPNLLDY